MVIYRARQLMLMLLQMGIVAFSAATAFELRFDFDVAPLYQSMFWSYVAISIAIKLPIFHLFGLNQGWWRYSSVTDMLTILRAVTLSHAILAIFYLLPTQAAVPRSIMLMDFAVNLLLLGGIRVSLRLFLERMRSGARAQGRRAGDRRALIVGAGEAGVNLVRHLRSTGVRDLVLVGFVDDSVRKQSLNLYGLDVLGRVDDLPRLVQKHRIDEIMIAIPSLSKSELKRIVDVCISCQRVFKTIPSVKDIVEGKERAYSLREVQVEDLLGREPIQLDKSKTHNEIRGSVVMITGAGGSIGSELCRQILSFQPRNLILAERSEEKLFYVERELRSRFPEMTITPVVLDILDSFGVRDCMHRLRPQFVFHAAAHKHVPLMEETPREAIRNNILGTRNVVDAALEFGVKSFVMISTDKAVNPLNTMGYSKRMAELVVQDRSQRTMQTKFMSVRFGNVLGSSGSAVEIFRKQLAAGEPLTVTDAQATRFFMTAPEAVELVLHAGTHGQNGEVYMLDMGQPVKIADLARKMIQLSDPLNCSAHRIRFTGLRRGEKLAEEIVWEGEDFAPSGFEKVFRLKFKVAAAEVPARLQYLEGLLINQTGVDYAKELKSIVDELDLASRQEQEVGSQSSNRAKSSSIPSLN